MKEQMSLLAIISRFGEEGRDDLVTSLPKILCPWCVHAGPGRRRGERGGGWGGGGGGGLRGGGGEGCYPTAENNQRGLEVVSSRSCPPGGTNGAEWSLGEVSRVQCMEQSWRGRGDGEENVSGKGKTVETSWKVQSVGLYWPPQCSRLTLAPTPVPG